MSVNLGMIPVYQIMHLSSRTVGDIDVTNFDFESGASYIICKAFEYGSMEDLVEAWAYYGDERTKTALLKATSLRPETRRLAASLFALPESSFLSLKAVQDLNNSSSNSTSYNPRLLFHYKKAPKTDDN